MKLTDLKETFVVSAEIPPPRGADPEKYLSFAKALKGKVHFINVTDNQRAVMRMSPLAFCRLLLDNGLDPVLQLCCRDRNRLALQSDILGASALGIRNLCLMTGDFTTLGDHKEGKPVFDFDSVQLIECAQKLLSGTTSAGGKLTAPPDYCIGAVVNPDYQPVDLQIVKMKKKIRAGARFFQTQPIYSTESLDRFNDLLYRNKIEVPVLFGVTPLKSVKFIDFMNAHILSEPIPDTLRERIAKSSDPVKESLDMAIEFMLANKKKVAGFHLMPIGLEEHTPILADALR